MDTVRIGELLRPFLEESPTSGKVLSDSQLSSIATYVEMLVRWNSRMNLTAIRAPEEIVTRHFGESLFAAQHIFPETGSNAHVIDVGSGAGFPGLPIKLWAKDIRLTLIESNHKKATFLREVIRTLKLEDAEVFAGRAEAFSLSGDVVTLRAVERFEGALPTALSLVKPGGRIVLLIGESQNETTLTSPAIRWLDPVVVPRSERRILTVGVMNQSVQDSH